MKDPAVLFYTSDFITGTLTMTDAQRGKYIILLCLQHQQGYLDEQDMLNICKTYDEKIFSKFEKDAMGYYYNKRMLFETEKRNKYSESRRKNRMNICKTYDKHMENENINKDIRKVSFETFWNLYNRKVGDKKGCEKKWNKLSCTNQEKIISILPAYLKTIKDKQYQPYPTTFLNQERWDNEDLLTSQEVKPPLESHTVVTKDTILK